MIWPEKSSLEPNIKLKERNKSKRTTKEICKFVQQYDNHEKAGFSTMSGWEQWLTH